MEEIFKESVKTVPALTIFAIMMGLIIKWGIASIHHTNAENRDNVDRITNKFTSNISEINKINDERSKECHQVHRESIKAIHINAEATTRLHEAVSKLEKQLEHRINK